MLLTQGLLPHRTAPLSHEERKFFRGRCVLITGAGGSIGAALARKIARLDASKVILLESSESALYQVHRAVTATAQGAGLVVPVLGSILDRSSLRETFVLNTPEVVFHCAALKHVPLLESQVVEAVRHNVLGTQRVLETALEHGCSRVVLLSTDKAVAPSSVMGATKLLAEQIALGLLRQGERSIRIVRLCNVLGTSGSVAPLFQEQIRRGGMVTVTSAAATRYFITRRDAVRLLLRAAVLAGVAGILLPQTPTLMRIRDLALQMLSHARVPAPEDRICYTGLRAAEKLAEQLAWREEGSPRPLGGDIAAVEGRLVDGIDELLAQVRRAASARDESTLVAQLWEARRLAHESPGGNEEIA